MLTKTSAIEALRVTRVIVSQLNGSGRFSATVGVAVRGENGEEERRSNLYGTNPSEAIVATINILTDREAEVIRFRVTISSLSGQAEADVKLKKDGRIVLKRIMDPDPYVAIARAYFAALMEVTA